MGGVVGQEVDGLVGDRVGIEEVVVECLVRSGLSTAGQCPRLVIAAAAGECAEEGVEAPCGWPGVVGVLDVVREVPLAPDGGRVSDALEHFGGRNAAVDLYGTALVLEEFGNVIAPSGAGVVIASQSGHRLGALTVEEDAALAMTPADELLTLPML